METIFSPDMIAFWTLLGSVLGTLLAALLLLAATLWASKQVTQQARDLWAVVRGYQPRVIAVVDDPTDAVNAQLGRITPVPAVIWAAVLPAFVNALADALNHALAVGSDESDDPADSSAGGDTE